MISDPLIRNRATLGGSLAEADPHGDWPPVVLAVGATVHLRNRDGERALSASEFFTPNGDEPVRGFTALRQGELLTAVTVPAAGARSRSNLSQAHASRVRARDAGCGGRRRVDATKRAANAGSPLPAPLLLPPGPPGSRSVSSARVWHPTRSRLPRTRQTTESPSPAPHSAPPLTAPSRFPSTSAEPCRISRPRSKPN